MKHIGSIDIQNGRKVFWIPIKKVLRNRFVIKNATMFHRFFGSLGPGNPTQTGAWEPEKRVQNSQKGYNLEIGETQTKGQSIRRDF